MTSRTDYFSAHSIKSLNARHDNLNIGKNKMKYIAAQSEAKQFISKTIKKSN
jgi:hypothetical protein